MDWYTQIEILMGKKAGAAKADVSYPSDTINYLVNEKLKNLAEGLNKFGKDPDNGKDKLAKKKSEAK